MWWRPMNEVPVRPESTQDLPCDQPEDLIRARAQNDMLLAVGEGQAQAPDPAFGLILTHRLGSPRQVR